MTKSVLGVLFLVIASVNIFWAAKIARLLRKGGSDDERKEFARRVNNLARLSRGSYLVVGIMMLAFLFLAA
jgi:hypothetical protein